MVRWPNSGEAVAVGGDRLLGCFPPAGGLCPELGVSSDEASAHRKTELRRELFPYNCVKRKGHTQTFGTM